MHVFLRSAPIFMTLSVALAGCSEADSQAAKVSTASSTKQPSSESAAAIANPNGTEVCLTVEGMT